MRHVYVDASVLLRVVLDEPRQLLEWDDFDAPVTSCLTEVEALRTIDRATRRVTYPRKRPLSHPAAAAARKLLYDVMETFGRIDLAPAIVTRAGQLQGPLGTLDALHLATALAYGDHTGARTVVATHDPELAGAAAAHGLVVVGS